MMQKLEIQQETAPVPKLEEPAVVAQVEQQHQQQQQLRPSFISKAAPPLGPVGSGGWQIEEDMTEDMRQVRSEALEQVEKEGKARLSQWHLDFLTAATLVNYVEPIATGHLVNTLRRRKEKESLLTAKTDIYLNSSFRVIGWDGEGTSVVAHEWCTMRKSCYYGLDQVEYLGWTSMDLNKPGANGFITIVDFGGGFNPFHFLNPKPILALAGMIEGQWRRRLKAAYMVEMPPSFQRFMTFFLRALKDTTCSKFHFCSSPEEMLSTLESMGCDEETRETCRLSMVNRREPDARQKWFPVVDHSFFKDKLADLGWSQDLEYLSERHHERLREAIQQFRVWKWGLPQARPRPSAAEAVSAAGSGLLHGRSGGGVRAEEAAAASMPLVASRQDQGMQGTPLPVEAARGRKKARPRSLLRRTLGCLVCGACGQ